MEDLKQDKPGISKSGSFSAISKLESLIDAIDSCSESDLDVPHLPCVTYLNFTESNLSKRIPSLRILNAIIDSYPDL